ncbi:50S ribosomal protein L23 [candidate division WOR-1 bacterium RIFCSPLOWO2_02_FULL_46_20]|uniref:Large ribosomal subunit protein uL23 n=2 Tax=Saganbacteria TaxID=1703751 RepID=A0A1F4R754_UNCSA|nr:MAG: 50S ribosomal protein L23 [candidate division WOR-1 bacterium RIFCSPHIGHO2_02_FULL_45_12]OGC03273.1 MAG: 50S ribosomal protein L23 [candidate division WOR-1 bacterium RIFCSPLOWO2_02_FULL_46_20]OGC08919.1 MAG: 50S ribosomal protein L23 [candidate division WOR-1 bacterium RIFCSPLOWO2_12_FULL_45_9]
MLPEQIILKPLITEKAVGQKVDSRYVFKVHLDATKVGIKQAIEQLFKVKVLAVNTCKVRAKRKVVGKSVGRTSQWKKAYVSLTRGQTIEELEA